jgi:hypothetical protein
MSGLKPHQTDEIIDALGPRGLKIYATAVGWKLEILRAGFLRAVAAQSGIETPNSDDDFRHLIKKARETYLNSKTQ